MVLATTLTRNANVTQIIWEVEWPLKEPIELSLFVCWINLTVLLNLLYSEELIITPHCYATVWQWPYKLSVMCPFNSNWGQYRFKSVSDLKLLPYHYSFSLQGAFRIKDSGGSDIRNLMMSIIMVTSWQCPTLNQQ